MNAHAKHPDVVPYAQGEPVSRDQQEEIDWHLAKCGECRDLVLFIRKTNATLQYEGRVSRLAEALRMSVEQIEQEIRLGTTIAALVNRPPESPVAGPVAPLPPVSPAKK